MLTSNWGYWYRHRKAMGAQGKRADRRTAQISAEMGEFGGGNGGGMRPGAARAGGARGRRGARKPRLLRPDKIGASGASTSKFFVSATRGSALRASQLPNVVTRNSRLISLFEFSSPS
jgi:hypothetical protein